MDELCDGNHAIKTKLEYESQLFDCSSDEVAKGIVQVVKANVNANIYDFFISLKNNFKDTDEMKMRNMNRKLKSLYQTSSEQPLEDLMKSIEEIFSIPPNVLLPEDKAQRKQCSSIHIEKVDYEIKTLSQRIVKVKHIETTLEREYLQNKDILNKHSGFLKNMENGNS